MQINDNNESPCFIKWRGEPDPNFLYFKEHFR